MIGLIPLDSMPSFFPVVELFCRFSISILQLNPARRIYFEGLEPIFANLKYLCNGKVDSLQELSYMLGIMKKFKVVKKKNDLANDLHVEFSSPLDGSKFISDLEHKLVAIPLDQKDLIVELADLNLPGLWTFLCEKSDMNVLGSALNVFEKLCRMAIGVNADKWIGEYYLPLLKESALDPARSPIVLKYFDKICRCIVSAPFLRKVIMSNVECYSDGRDMKSKDFLYTLLAP